MQHQPVQARRIARQSRPHRQSFTRALDNNTTAPLNPDTIDILRRKHPVGTHNPISLPLHHRVPLLKVPDTDNVLDAHQSFR